MGSSPWFIHVSLKTSQLQLLYHYGGFKIQGRSNVSRPDDLCFQKLAPEAVEKLRPCNITYKAWKKYMKNITKLRFIYTHWHHRQFSYAHVLAEVSRLR